MKPLMEEYLNEEHRRDILREVDQIHQAELAPKGTVFHPNWFTHAMQALGRWLITEGQELVARYESPSRPARPAEGDYAR